MGLAGGIKKRKEKAPHFSPPYWKKILIFRPKCIPISSMSFITIYTTHASEAAAQNIVDGLIERRLIACANVFAIQSAYWWEGAVAREGEWVALVKTIPEHWEAVRDWVEAAHPYDLPCIMRTEVSANRAYEDWIRESVRPPAETKKP